ncbi:MAG: hypothetical protein EZS28_026116, partial [Streblomastix strix]
IWAVGSDSGTSSVNCALLACKAYHTISNKYVYIVVDEVSHDYTRERATQLDSEFATTMINLARKGKNTRIAAPHENSNLLEELRRQSAPIHGLGTLRKYVPNNLEDIRYLQGLFNGCGSNGVETLLVVEGCTELTMSLQNYVWDLERGERSGRDVPLKDGNDHYPDSLRGAIRFLRQITKRLRAEGVQKYLSEAFSWGSLSFVFFFFIFFSGGWAGFPGAYAVLGRLWFVVCLLLCCCCVGRRSLRPPMGTMGMGYGY